MINHIRCGNVSIHGIYLAILRVLCLRIYYQMILGLAKYNRNESII